jgi:hypothetical protein
MITKRGKKEGQTAWIAGAVLALVTYTLEVHAY